MTHIKRRNDYDDTLNMPSYATDSRLFAAILFSFLTVVGLGSNAVGSLLDAPNRGAGQIADQVAGPGQRLAGQIATIANKRPFVDRLKDVTANPSRWKVVRSVTEPAKGMHNRGGRSLQELLRNEETGETIVRHTLFKANGGIFDPAHFRDIWK